MPIRLKTISHCTGGAGVFQGRPLSTSALYALSALAAEARASDGITLKFGGYSNTLFSAGSINDSPSRDDPSDVTDYGSTGLWKNTKLELAGRYTHDNAMQFGATIEIEIFAFEPNEIFTVEQRFAWVESSLDRLELGSNYSAAYRTMRHRSSAYRLTPAGSRFSFHPIPIAP